MPSSDTTLVTPDNINSGRGGGKRGRGGSSQPSSTPSALPSKLFGRVWKQPKTVKELTAQVNAVSTLLLNGKLPLDIVRTYGSLMDAAARLIHTEIHKSRMISNPPDLTLGDDVFDRTD